MRPPFPEAGTTHKDTGYIPPELKDEVIAHIDLVGPRKSGEVTFKAPETPGDYPFLCSFPAHYLTGHARRADGEVSAAKRQTRRLLRPERSRPESPARLERP